MTTRKSKETKRVANDFPPIYDKRSRILILGSLPSEASRAAGFYYMHPRNRFWSLFSALLGKDLVKASKEEKAATLKEAGIALYDVVLSCKIRRSDDASIAAVERADVPAILDRAPISKIFLNGKKAYALFLKHFPQYASIAVCLPSTSPANAKSSIEDLITVWRAEIGSFLP